MHEYHFKFHRFNRLHATRIVSTPAAIDAIDTSQALNDRLLLRTAADELLIVPPTEEIELADPYAIIVEDASYSALSLDEPDAQHILSHICLWELPSERPAFAQGAIAGIATKLYLEEERVLVIVSTPYAEEMSERMGHFRF